MPPQTPRLAVAESATFADEPCAGRGSPCGRTCYLDNDAWTYETTMSLSGIENDVEAYCMCEHHQLQGSPAGLMSHIRERIDRARRQAR